jgi:hypothetical protein
VALLQLHHAFGCLGSSRGSSSTTSPTSRLQVPRLVTRFVALLIVDYFTYVAPPGASARHGVRRAARRRLLRLRCATRCLGTSRLVMRLVVLLVVDYFAYAAHPGASAHRAARHATRRRLLRLRHTSGCLGTSRGSSRGSSHRSSSTNSPTPRVRMPRHIARLVVDYFDYAARLGASAHCATRRQLRLSHASGCLGTSRGSSRGSPSTTSTMPRVRVPRHIAWLVAPLIVNFDYAARPDASARRAARRTACRRLLCLCRASECLVTLRGSSHRSSSTNLPTRARPGASARVTQLVVDFFAYATRSGASARRVAHHRLLRASRLLVLRQHLLYFEYTAPCREIVFRSHRVYRSSQLIFQTSRE